MINFLKLTTVMILCLCSCSLPRAERDELSVKAKLIYLEPFPFASPLNHHGIDYKQAGWIQRVDTGDSLAVFFGADLTGGEDASKVISMNYVYDFFLRRQRKPASPQDTIDWVETDSMLAVIDSDSVMILADSVSGPRLLEQSNRVKADTYWRVVQIDVANSDESP